MVKGGEVDRLRRESIKKRCIDRGLDGDFETNWAGITALNSGFLDHGIFEDSVGGLKELVWANRSLHEFLLAYFFANLADEADTYCSMGLALLKGSIRHGRLLLVLAVPLRVGRRMPNEGAMVERHSDDLSTERLSPERRWKQANPFCQAIDGDDLSFVVDPRRVHS